MTNCLIIIRNKKLNIDYDRLSSFLRVFSGACYYFDKISVIGFDNSKVISEQLKECRGLFENTIVLCKDEQLTVVRDYLEKICGESFDGRTYINCGASTICVGSAGENMAFAHACVEILNKKYGVSYDKFYIKCISAPSSLVYDAIESAGKQGGDTAFAVYDDYGDQTIEVSYSSNTPKMVADGVQRALLAALGGYVYALENTTIERRLYDLLKLRRMTISVAESFTGGGIAARLVSVPGVSEVYFEGLNTYANGSKMLRLGVDEITLKQYGAVSEKTACEMAEGLIKGGNCDIAISTTGIAGPKSDNTSKPVGLAYIGIATKEETKVYKFNYRGDRETITKTAINDALFLAYKMIK